MLRSANVEGAVLVQFVVDTLGRVDSTTVHVLKSTHDLFTNAVKDVVFRYKFRPAELAGRKVKQLVQMPFDFRVP
jgi:protein TonB